MELKPSSDRVSESSTLLEPVWILKLSQVEITFKLLIEPVWN